MLIVPSPSEAQGNGPNLTHPVAISCEADGSLVVLDADPFGFVGVPAVFRIDPITGNRSILSDHKHGSGVDFDAPADVAVAKDGSVWVTDADLDAVFSVDPTTGDRTIRSGCFLPSCPFVVGEGPAFDNVVGLAVEADGSPVVTDTFTDKVLRIEPLTGDRSEITQFDNMAGSYIQESLTVGFDGTLYIADAFAAAVFQVDPSTGEIVVLSDEETGSGTLLQEPVGIAVESDGPLLVADDPLDGVPRIFRIDPSSGDRTIVSDFEIGKGPPFSRVEDVAVGLNGVVWVPDDQLDAIFRVDPVTGDRSIVSGSETNLEQPYALAIVSDSNKIAITDGVADAILGLSPVSGELRVISSDQRGSGPSLEFATGITTSPLGSLLVADRDAILEVDRSTGDRVLLSGCAERVGANCLDPIGGGPFFDDVEDLEVMGTAIVGVAIVDDDGSDSWVVFLVEPETGDRSILSGLDQGNGPSLLDLTAIAGEGIDTLVVADAEHNSVTRVNRIDGDRTIVSGCLVPGFVECQELRGKGPPFAHLEGIVVEDDGSIVVVSSEARAITRVDPVTGDRTRVSDADRGEGSLFFFPTDLKLAPDGSFIVSDLGSVISNEIPPATYQVDPVTGDRSILYESE